MKESSKKILLSFLEFLVVSILSLTVPLVLVIDIKIIGHGLSEYSITEFAQETLLLLTVFLSIFHACRDREKRGFFILVAGFFLTLFVRELDFVFDELLFHGAWIYPAVGVVLAALILAFCNRHSIIEPLAKFVHTRPYYFIMLGLVIVLAFSRTFGSGNQLWEYVMGDDYKHLFKTAIQEGLELLGYILIFYGACMFSRQENNEPNLNYSG
ncbi:MAG: hypothetical protein ACOCZS_00920 [Verrucomicrobiota bacterium]